MSMNRWTCGCWYRCRSRYCGSTDRALDLYVRAMLRILNDSLHCPSKNCVCLIAFILPLSEMVCIAKKDRRHRQAMQLITGQQRPPSSSQQAPIANEKERLPWRPPTSPVPPYHSNPGFSTLPPVCVSWARHTV